jgi:hypothetical protein
MITASPVDMVDTEKFFLCLFATLAFDSIPLSGERLDSKNQILDSTIVCRV